MTLEEIRQEIMNAPENQQYTQEGWQPVYTAYKDAKILIIGQAPGRKAQESGIVWDDESGVRLRNWLDVSKEEFYDSHMFAVLPMDFYFQGVGKSGDLPPRKDFAEKWHPKLIEAMPNIQLTLLVGSYAVKYYLNEKSGFKLTDVVENFEYYLPKYFPLIHPSPRNQIWMVEHPWFKADVIPVLQKMVKKILDK